MHSALVASKICMLGSAEAETKDLHDTAKQSGARSATYLWLQDVVSKKLWGRECRSHTMQAQSASEVRRF